MGVGVFDRYRNDVVVAKDFNRALGATGAIGHEQHRVTTFANPLELRDPFLDSAPELDRRLTGNVEGVSLMRLSTTRAQVARAVVDGVLHQVVDALEAIGGISRLRLDGGLARSGWVVQRLADLAGVPVERAGRADSTALGAATLDGLAAGVWATDDALPRIPPDLVAEPALPGTQRDDRRERWIAARAVSERWPVR